MDALVSMGAGAALLYGLYAIVMIGIGLKNDDMELIMRIGMTSILSLLPRF